MRYNPQKFYFNLHDINDENYSKLLNIEHNFYYYNEFKKYNHNEWKILYKNNHKISKYLKYVY